MDWWAHRVCDNPKLREEIVDPDYEDEVAAMEAAIVQRAATRAAEAEAPAPPPPPPGDEWETVADDKWS